MLYVRRTAERREGTLPVGAVETRPWGEKNLPTEGATTCRRHCSPVWEEAGVWSLCRHSLGLGGG